MPDISSDASSPAIPARADRHIEKARLDAAHELVVTVNHEINNPLTALMVYAELLAGYFADTHDPERLEYVRQIVRAARRLKKINQKLIHNHHTRTIAYYGETKMIDLE